jgi:hypothetical protein
MDLESRMKFIQESEYLRVTSNLWWDKLTKKMTSGSRRDIIHWALNTASLEDTGFGGNMNFDDMKIVETEFTNLSVGKGLKLRRPQFEDLDGNGVDLALEWAKQIGSQVAYWPQKSIVKLLKDGALATSLGYDGVPFFSASHPNYPGYAANGTYANLITGKQIYGVTVDVALANLQSVFSTIASIKMPDGETPRFLRPAGILCNPLTYPVAVQLTNARFLAQAATGGGAASADVQALIGALGYGQPIMADEFAGFESNTTYFVFCDIVTSSELGGMVYIDREPITTRYYSGRSGSLGIDAQLDRSDELEWHATGRNVAGYGHPYAIFKVTA